MEKFKEYDDDIDKTEPDIYDEIRHQLYGCNGDCYGAHGQICPCIDTCEETRLKEGFATGVTVVVIVLISLVIFGVGIGFVLKFLFSILG